MTNEARILEIRNTGRGRIRAKFGSRYLFSEMETHQRGARTVPVRSASEKRRGLEKPAVCAPDNPLRTGTVRGPI